MQPKDWPQPTLHGTEELPSQALFKILVQRIMSKNNCCGFKLLNFRCIFFLYKWTCLSIPAILIYHLWAVCWRYILCTNIMVDSEWNSWVCQSVTHNHLKSVSSALTKTLHVYYWLSNQIYMKAHKEERSLLLEVRENSVFFICWWNVWQQYTYGILEDRNISN